MGHSYVAQASHNMYPKIHHKPLPMIYSYYTDTIVKFAHNRFSQALALLSPETKHNNADDVTWRLELTRDGLTIWRLWQWQRVVWSSDETHVLTEQSLMDRSAASSDTVLSDCRANRTEPHDGNDENDDDADNNDADDDSNEDSTSAISQPNLREQHSAFEYLCGYLYVYKYPCGEMHCRTVLLVLFGGVRSRACLFSENWYYILRENLSVECTHKTYTNARRARDRIYVYIQNRQPQNNERVHARSECADVGRIAPRVASQSRINWARLSDCVADAERSVNHGTHKHTRTWRKSSMYCAIYARICFHIGRMAHTHKHYVLHTVHRAHKHCLSAYLLVWFGAVVARSVSMVVPVVCLCVHARVCVSFMAHLVHAAHTRTHATTNQHTHYDMLYMLGVDRSAISLSNMQAYIYSCGKRVCNGICLQHTQRTRKLQPPKWTVVLCVWEWIVGFFLGVFNRSEKRARDRVRA